MIRFDQSTRFDIWRLVHPKGTDLSYTFELYNVVDPVDAENQEEIVPGTTEVEEALDLTDTTFELKFYDDKARTILALDLSSGITAVDNVLTLVGTNAQLNLERGIYYGDLYFIKTSIKNKYLEIHLVIE